MEYSIELKRTAIKDFKIETPYTNPGKNGKKEFAIIPYEEFLLIKEILEDYEDLCDLRAAKRTTHNSPSIPLGDVIKELRLDS